MENFKVVVDASYLLKIFLPEDKSKEAEEQWKSWIEESAVFLPLLGSGIIL